jgi:hypothetical protein
MPIPAFGHMANLLSLLSSHMFYWRLNGTANDAKGMKIADMPAFTTRERG